MDQYYVESGYWDTGYSVYTAEAALTGAMEFAVSADAIANKPFNSTITSESTVSCTISHIHGADLVAFSDASVNAINERIRGFDAVYSSASTLSLDFGVIKQGASGIDAAFSQTSLAGFLKQFNADWSYYIEDDYHTPNDYYQGYGSLGSITCDLTEILNIEGEAHISCAGTLSAVVGKLQIVTSDLVVEFSQSATISHIEGADLFAFSDAQIAALVDRIRDYNISTSTAFDIASDYIRVRLADSAESAEFSISSSGERSRSFASALEAAFSFASTEDRLRDVTSNLNTEVTVALDASRTRDLASTISSDFATSATATRIQELAANISSEASITCVISHIEGADLVAFADAALSLQPKITRTVSADIQSTSSVLLSADRLRDYSSIVEVAADIAATIDNIRGFDATLSSAVTLVADVGEIPQFGADLTSSLELVCTISHIEGADLVAFADAALSADAQRIRFGQSQISAATSISASVDKRKGITLTNLAVSANIVAIPRKGYTYRPLSVVVQNGPASQRIVTSNQSKFGGKSLYIESSGSFGNRPYIRYADSSRLDGIGGRAYAFFDLWIRLETNSADIFKVWNPTTGSTSYGLIHTSGGLYYKFTNPGSGTFTFKIANALSLNTWHHIAVRADFTSGGGSWINGSRTSNTALPIYYTASTHLEIGDSQLGSGDSTQRFYIDEFRILVGTDSQLNALGFNAELNSTITVPTARYYDSDTDITQFLAHYDIDYRDDVGALLNADASISSSASLVANAIRPVEYDSVFASEFQQTANGDRLRGIDSLLANQTTVSAQPVAVFDANANISSQADSQASLGIIKEFACALSSEATVSCVISHIHGADLLAFSDAALAVQGAVIRDTGSTLTSNFAQSTVNDRIRFNDSTLAAEFQQAAVNERTRDTGSTLAASSPDFYADAMALRGFNVAMESAANSQISVDKFVGYAADFTSEAALASTALRIQELSAAIASEGSQLTIVIKVGEAVVDCAIILTATIDAAKTAEAASNTSSDFALVTTPVNLYDVPVNLTAASSLSVELGIVKEYASSVNADIALVANATASTDVVVAATSEFNQQSVFDLTRGATSNQSAEFNSTIEYIRGRFVDIYLDSFVDQYSIANAVFDYAAVLESSSSLSCTISHIEGADLVAFSNAALTIEYFVGKVGESYVTAAADINVSLTRIRSSDVSISAEFTSAQAVNYIADNQAQIASQADSQAIGAVIAGGFSNLNLESNLSCTISHIEGAELVAFSDAAVTTTPNRIRDLDSQVTATATVAADLIRIRSSESAVEVAAELNCSAIKVNVSSAALFITSNVSAQVNVTIAFTITINDAMTFTAGVREIDYDSLLQNVYKIPKEIWDWDIAEETRIYKIRS